MSSAVALTTLAADGEKGLSSAEAAWRLAKIRRQRIVQKRGGRLHQPSRYFTGPIAVMIEAAAVI
jgi:hypothetical protein